jgi:Mg-chelatase subunit ChlD
MLSYLGSTFFGFYATLLLSWTQPAQARDVVVCNNVTETLPVDILFLVDASGSMCPYIQQIEAQLQTFVDQLALQGQDAQFAVAAFGGQPVLLQPFSVSILYPSYNMSRRTS